MVTYVEQLVAKEQHLFHFQIHFLLDLHHFGQMGQLLNLVIFDGLTWQTPGYHVHLGYPGYFFRAFCYSSSKKWQLYFWQVLGWHGLLEMACRFNDFLYQHDISSSARPSSWLCWFTWSNGSCDTPEPNCHIWSWSSGFLFLARPQCSVIYNNKHSKHICQR